MANALGSTSEGLGSLSPNRESGAVPVPGQTTEDLPNECKAAFHCCFEKLSVQNDGKEDLEKLKTLFDILWNYQQEFRDCTETVIEGLGKGHHQGMTKEPNDRKEVTNSPADLKVLHNAMRKIEDSINEVPRKVSALIGESRQKQLTSPKIQEDDQQDVSNEKLVPRRISRLSGFLSDEASLSSRRRSYQDRTVKARSHPDNKCPTTRGFILQNASTSNTTPLPNSDIDYGVRLSGTSSKRPGNFTEDKASYLKPVNDKEEPSLAAEKKRSIWDCSCDSDNRYPFYARGKTTEKDTPPARKTKATGVEKRCDICKSII